MNKRTAFVVFLIALLTAIVVLVLCGHQEFVFAAAKAITDSVVTVIIIVALVIVLLNL